MSCVDCVYWNPVRYDDWGCCENTEVTMLGNFTPAFPGRFQCNQFEED